MPDIIEAIFSLNLPTVAMDLSDEQLADNRYLKKISEIRPDAHKVGRMAAEPLLERGFRRFGYCGHPQSPNWSRIRIGLAKQLLAETDLSFLKIADNTGFSSKDHLSKAFSRAAKTTLAKYRREHRPT